jgi:hypothetical protein
MYIIYTLVLVPGDPLRSYTAHLRQSRHLYIFYTFVSLKCV